MDRPIRVTDLQLLDGGNCRCVEATDPAGLQDRVNQLIAYWAASANFYPYLQSWEIAGTGSGATWRANLELGRGDDWGLNTAVPAGIAHFICREASHVDQLTAVQNAMLTTIFDTSGAAGYVVGTKICGPKGNGTYLVAMLWVDGVGQAPTIHAASYDPQPNLAVDTIVAQFTLAAAWAGNAAYAKTYMLHYAVELADDLAAGTGVGALVLLDGAPLYQDNWIAAAAAEWRTFSGHHYVRQLAGAGQTFALQVSPGAGNTVSVRAARMDALLIIDENAGA